MSFHALATGTLTADPQRRQGPKASFSTGTLRVDAGGGEIVFLSIIAFGETAEQLLEFAAREAISVSGRARPTSWTNGSGEECRGLSVTVEQIASLKSRAKATDRPAYLKNSNKDPPRQRHSYPKHRLARDPVPDLPADSVDDLYAEIIT